MATQPNSTEIIRDHLEKPGGFIEHCVDSFLYEFLLNNHDYTGGERKTDEDIVAFINSYAPTDPKTGVTVGWEIDGQQVELTTAALKNIRRELRLDQGGTTMTNVNKKLLKDFKKLYSGNLGTRPGKYTGESDTGSPEVVGWKGQHDTYYMTQPDNIWSIFKNVGAGLHGPDNGPADFNGWDLQIAIALIANTGLIGSNVSRILGETSDKYVQVCTDKRGATVTPDKDQYIPLEHITFTVSEEMTSAGTQAYVSQATSYSSYMGTGTAPAPSATALTRPYRDFQFAAMQQGDMSLAGQWSQDIPDQIHWPEVSASFARWAGTTTCGRNKKVPDVGGYQIAGAVYTAAKLAQQHKMATREHNSRFVARVARNYQEKIAERLAHLLDDVDNGLLKDLKREAEDIPFFRQPVKDRRRTAALKEVDNEIQKKLAKYKKKLKPVDHQCYLLENIKKITDFQEDKVTDARGTPYKYIGRVTNSGESGQPGNIVSYINHGNKNTIIDRYLQICPDVYAFLTPYIKIYRVDYLKDNPLRAYKETQIPFPNFIDPDAIEGILDGKFGRYPGGGIKSFSWSLDGTQPAAVENNITAKLQLYFQTVQDLFSLNYKSDTAPPQAGIPNQAGYLDLIIGSGTSFRKEGDQIKAAKSRNSGVCQVRHDIYKGEHFRIKVCVGWSVPPDFENKVSEFSDLDAKEAGHLKRAIAMAKTSLYLQITTHELTFNEDGSVDISINYQAALSGILRSPNADLFVGSDKYRADKEDLNGKIDRLRKEIKRTSIGDAGAEGLSPEQQRTGEADADRLEKLLEERAALTKKDKMLKYKKFLGGVYDSGKVYNLPVGLDAWQFGLIRDMSPADRAAEAVRRKNPASSPVLNPQLVSLREVDNLEAEAMAAAAAAAETSDTGEETDAMKRYRDAMANSEVEIQDRKSPDVLYLPFIYLGDLIEAILQDLEFLTTGDSFQLLMGQIEILDPLLAFQIREIVVACGGEDGSAVAALAEIDPLRFTGVNKIVYSTNISNLPISLDYFQTWFTTTVVKPLKEQYTLLKFIKDICATLIAKAFNSKCFDEKLKYHLRFDTATFSLDKKFAGKMNILPRDLAKAKFGADSTSCVPLQAGKKDQIPAVLIYSVDSKPFTGNYNTDLNNGIYHYFMGARCGLAKKISFHRNDMQYYREARLERHGALGAEQLRELYSVNIDMVGNTIHRNGQYIYVEPIGIGVGSMRSTGTQPNLAKQLGFGGYYMITKVASVVSITGFDTTVTAMQEGINLEQNKIIGGRLWGHGGELYTGTDGDPPKIGESYAEDLQTYVGDPRAL